MSAIEGLRRREPGVYRVRGGTALAERRLRAWGWRVATLGAAPGGTKDDLLGAVGDALGFPDWYGRNLDALADCLTDLAAPTALVLAGWPWPEDLPGWAGVREVLDERIADTRWPAFAVVLDQTA
ncbi:barstar family protein [Naumannella cuiyingiana]|uniref:Barstar (barnase inhibitor) domain-containing protein n=1 Tax=Naumannella cuiyingiana TaxID=1347891 RepID=A0A7Z0DAR4_9ACTN|nr:barstar family protein [Naumannella cuiyingiana]NYI72071.1 hypothetical protein [Naumannella cuiyingiana]